MLLSSVHFRNYATFDDLELAFRQGMNVLFGVNGTGKTTILRALADVLHALPSPKARKAMLQPSLQKAGSSDCQVTATLEGASGSCIVHCSERGIHATQDDGSQDKDAMPQGPRIVSILSGKRDIHFARLKTRFARLESQEQHERQRDSTYRDPILERIRASIAEIAPGLQNLHIKKERVGHPLCVEKNGMILDVASELSAGENFLVGLLAHIALELDTASRANQDMIVLLDNPEASLHPLWQMQLCPLLKKTFPKVQFILASLSPFMWASLDRREIVWLDYNEKGKVAQKRVSFARGASIENILASFFQVPGAVDEAASEVHIIETLIEQGNAMEAQKAIEALRERFGEIPVLAMLDFRLQLLNN
ncbi:hypothetical protein B5F76_00925 [Desulfovibrio sp. An276]|uniref:AAA family ATPase n=1 Tax=Desulfovibrio sp. An276 TaxID=1965618 RepID=UPI000B378F5E|nr:AAA family ATPase [Desulfovibrio sp. An276]OUO55208.1 hypothetical protein B5F76_00925 [Desulfovibrio sp. An276]